MKWSKEDKSKFTESYLRRGKKKNYLCFIEYSDYLEYFHFSIYKGDYRFNSIFENQTYKTEEECITACEAKIDELVKGEHK